MGARRGSLTFTRYFIRGEPPKDLRQRYLKAIRLRAFRPLDPDAEASETSGWCVLGRPFDLGLEPDRIYNDELLLLGLRIDRYRLPSSLLDAQLLQEEQRLLAKTGKEKLSRSERADLKHQLASKLRRKLIPTTRCMDMVWDLRRGVVLFFSHGARTLLDFCALFEKTFGLTLDEDSPYLAAERAQLPRAVQRRLAKVEGLHLSNARKALGRAVRQGARDASAQVSHTQPSGQSPQQTPTAAETGSAPPDGETDALARRVETTRFLGTEFLLWIWLRSELLDTDLKLAPRQAWTVWLDKHLAFESPLDKNERVTIRGAAPTDAHEAREAVRARKFPVRGRIVLREAERDLSLDLVARRFAVASAEVPAVLSQEPEEALVERMELVSQLLSTLDALYAVFLNDRLSERWEAAWEPALAAWLEAEPIPKVLLGQLDAPSRARPARAPVRRDRRVPAGVVAS